MSDKLTLITLIILITCAVLSLLFITGSRIYFTWIHEPELSTPIADKDLAILNRVYKWHMQVENWKYKQQVEHIDKLIQRGAIK